MESPVYTVQAEFNFKGSNNDELCFKKGDIITVTQKEDGGWWEGTLDDKTGWFPSNYVKEIKLGAASTNVVDTIRPPEEIAQFRSVVFNDLLESEKAHVAELRGMMENFLEPLQESQILSKDEYAQLMCNFIEVVEAHEDLYQCLEDCNDRVGKIFLSKATSLKSVHQTYCASHPRAIVIVDKHKEALNNYMEREGAAKPGILVLTTGLSKPFRRLDKYSAILQELERHMELSHPDRGDTQRSIAVYKDLAATCIATRRQKELELQILTGPVRGWQGQELSSLGEIIHMGSVAVGADFRDRYFVLFPQTLLILSVSQRMSAFKYEGKLPLSGIIVNRLPDSEQVKNAFEISGPLIERISVVCQGPAEANKWVELLSSNNDAAKRRTGMELKRNISAGSVTGATPPTPPPHSTLARTSPQSNNNPSHHKRSHSFNHQTPFSQSQQSTPIKAPINGTNILARDLNKAKVNWTITNLHSPPPIMPSFTQTTAPSGASATIASILNKSGGGGAALTYEEDALILRVIESYSAAYQSTSRNTMHAALQPFTPVLPIRGGKLKATKSFSSSNPQLPFNTCVPPPQNASIHSSKNSIFGSSVIWREASPNNFHIYSASISSLNTSYRSRNSIMDCYNPTTGTSKSYWRNRAASEERPTTIKAFETSNTSTSAGTPLLGRKAKQIWKRMITLQR
ncbi:rho guanine nucleotide exchange factor 7 isoform X2 [Culicoides brevitarsis]|uniref:rho guanine nucleotide exchange factor 7 isoform X2 n=1 Tax=Culicoides brevitarsis TaxID=469753 RepID=UPI00307B11A8